ncbi:MAG: hypothetical protein Q9166_002421 [cf. Caloplaca sp. 2 TL-2023]
MYMEYCQNGDLHKLLAYYRDKRAFMPEAFIWHAFLNLAQACQSLKDLPLPYTNPDRNEIVHLDIKPENGDMDDEGGNPYYPYVKLGDFGIGDFTGVTDEDNPHGFWGAGTPGYKALEMEDFEEIKDAEKIRENPHIERAHQRQERFFKEDPNYQRPMILNHTNVWGIGAVMFQLMTLKNVKYYLYNNGTPDEDTAEAPVWAKLDDTPYHETLKILVWSCLDPDPDERPTADSLISDLKELERFWGINHWPIARNRFSFDREQSMPWGNFINLSLGDWQPSEGQKYHGRPKSTFDPSSSEARRRDQNKDERRAARKRRKQDWRDADRRRRRAEGDEDVSDDSGSVLSPINSEDRKNARAMKREGKWTPWWKKVFDKVGAEPTGFLGTPEPWF